MLSSTDSLSACWVMRAMATGLLADNLTFQPRMYYYVTGEIHYDKSKSHSMASLESGLLSLKAFKLHV